MADTAEIEAQFRDAAAERGLEIRDVIADGEIHRCGTKDRPRSENGAYVLHPDGIPAGGFINWRDGQPWQNWRADRYQTLSPAARRKAREQCAHKKARRHARNEAIRARVRALAQDIRSEAEPATHRHAYLDRKRVLPHGTFICPRTDWSVVMRAGDLMVPMRDINGVLHNLQFISPIKGARKLYMRGTQKGGPPLLFGIGRPEATGTIAIVEGFATGASVHEATSIPVAVAFDAGKLLGVALAVLAKYPQAQLLFAADDDWLATDANGNRINPGINKAHQAAEAVGGIVVVPDFGDERRPEETDFNDLQCRFGRDEVKRQIEAALNAKP
jgi:putative DNA primase/helicase